MAVALPDVVEDHAEEQELGLRQLAHHVGELRERVRELPLPQPLELAHADERVMVDGVDVERVVRDEPLEVAELREQRLQDAELVHLEQGLRDVPAAPQHAQERRRHLRRVARGRQQGEVLAQQLARGGREARAVALRLGEHLDHASRARPRTPRVR